MIDDIYYLVYHVHDAFNCLFSNNHYLAKKLNEFRFYNSVKNECWRTYSRYDYPYESFRKNLRRKDWIPRPKAGRIKPDKEFNYRRATKEELKTVRGKIRKGEIKYKRIWIYKIIISIFLSALFIYFLVTFLNAAYKM